MADTQQQLLQTLWPMLAPGGRMVYASCSALKAENEQNILAFLAQHSDARDVTRQAMQGLGFTAAHDLSTTGLAIQAGQEGMDGFYYACLHKTAG